MTKFRFPRPAAAVGTWPWLLLHELRLSWRNIGGKSIVLMVVLVAVLWGFMHLAAWAVMQKLSLAALERSWLPIAGLVCWFALSLMLSAAIAMVVNALFDRGDLDLLLSSPIEPFTVFLVRGLGVAVSAISLVLLLLLPFVHMGVYHGQWGLLAAYPVLFSMGLGVTGIAFAATLALVRLMGARKARVTAQVLSAITGAALFLLMQSENLVPQGIRREVAAALKALAAGPWFDVSSILWWPVRALFGDPLPTAAVLAAGLGMFWLVVRATCSTFLAGTQETVTRPAARMARTVSAGLFRAGIARNVLRKELLLIWRDPNLIAQSLLQALYLIPLAVILGRKAEFAVILAPTVILMCATLAGNLAWITVSGEEAEDLLGTAPVNLDRIRWLKVLAALLPVLAITLPFIGFYAARSVPLALIFTLCLCGALASCAVTQVWGGRTAGHRDLKKRYQQSRLLNFFEGLSAFGWAAACYGLMAGVWWAVAGLVPGLLAPAYVLVRRMRQRNS